jgi:hypothetical protein
MFYYCKDFDVSVKPGSEIEYTWIVHDSSGPSHAGSVLSTQTWMYHGDMSYEKDVNSGLVGAIVIADSKFITSDAQREAVWPCDIDEEVVLMMGTFDESNSW